MEVTINTNATTTLENQAIKNSLQTIAKNVSKEHLAWFADITKREGFNNKLESKKGFINTFL